MAQVPASSLPGADSNRLAADQGTLSSLRRQAGRDPQASTRQAALQFESLFMQQVLKGMRASTLSSGMFDNAGGDMAKTMLDEQMAKNISGRRGGLADVIEKQLNRQLANAQRAKASASGDGSARAEGLPLQSNAEPKTYALNANQSRPLTAAGTEAARLKALIAPASPSATATADALTASSTTAQLLQAQGSDAAPAGSDLASQVGDGVDALLRQIEAANWSMKALNGEEPGGACIVERPADVGTVMSTPRGRTEGIPQKGAAGFIERHSAAAAEASAASGIPAQFMISQAALETGWGRKEILRADGSSSYNLFGIKADANWKGPTADVTTTEYVNGRPQRVTARFRAYGSYAESFADYAKLLTTSPRYQGVVQQAKAGNWNGATASARQAAAAEGFAVGLQKAGYATDPAYATKLAGVIQTTLRLQRAMG